MQETKPPDREEMETTDGAVIVAKGGRGGGGSKEVKEANKGTAKGEEMKETKEEGTRGAL